MVILPSCHEPSEKPKTSVVHDVEPYGETGWLVRFTFRRSKLVSSFFPLHTVQLRDRVRWDNGPGILNRPRSRDLHQLLLLLQSPPEVVLVAPTTSRLPISGPRSGRVHVVS